MVSLFVERRETAPSALDRLLQPAGLPDGIHLWIIPDRQRADGTFRLGFCGRNVGRLVCQPDEDISITGPIDVVCQLDGGVALLGDYRCDKVWRPPHGFSL